MIPCLGSYSVATSVGERIRLRDRDQPQSVWTTSSDRVSADLTTPHRDEVHLTVCDDGHLRIEVPKLFR